MKIEVNNKGSRSYYNELAYIKLYFSKVLYNPGRPAKPVTSYVLTRVIGFLVVMLVAAYLYMNTKDIIYGLIFLALVVAEVGIIMSLVTGIKKMKSLMAEDKPRAIEVDQDGIRCYEDGKVNDLPWDDILCIALNKHSVAVLPKVVSMYGIYCTNEYKEEMISAVKEAGHFYMIEDNVDFGKKDRK